MKKINNHFTKATDLLMWGGKQLLKQKFFLMLILVSNLIYAANVSEEQAKIVAENFLKSETGSTHLKAMLAYRQDETDGSVAYYVFNFQNQKAFVIVTGNDNLKPVVAYSTESSFNISNTERSGVSYWLKKTHKQIQSAVTKNIQADARISGLWNAYVNGTPVMNIQSSSVLKLLDTEWNQGYEDGLEYNSLCPQSSNGKYCPVGCTATAMAQIMKFWNYPAQGTGSHSYDDNENSIQGHHSANFGATTYNWPEMSDPDLISRYVDTLMYQCGVAVETDYELDGSGAKLILGAHSAKDAYLNYFGYSSTIDGKTRFGHSTSNWIDMLKTELDAGRPVQYAGGNGWGKSHTWVVDGYNTSDWFHMNWGWGGLSNGWYNLDDISPFVNGEEISLNAYEEAIIGIQPPNRSECTMSHSLAGLDIYHISYTWQASDYITSSALISITMTNTYTAGNKITLTDGFWAAEGSTFEAKIQGCNSPRFGTHSSTEIENEEAQTFSAYPNPFTSILNIKYIQNSEGILRIELLDMQGKTIKSLSQTISGNGNEIAIPLQLDNITPGIYFLKLSDANTTSVKKIIKS